MTAYGRSYQECSRCVMDTSDPEIVFDTDGYCNHCREFLAVRSNYRLEGEAGERELERILTELRAAGKGKPYDCVLGMSGGVDSSYLAYILAERGIRSLAVHMDNGWDTAESVSNIRNLTQCLGIDYQCDVLDWDQFRDVQLSFLKASVPDAELPTDVAIPAVLHKFAARYGIKHILSAGVFSTEGILPRSWQYNPKDLKYLTHIHGRFGSGRRDRFPIFDYKLEAYYKVVRGLKTYYPLNCVDFHQEKSIELLIEKCGFRRYGEKHHESRYTRFVQSYYLYRKFGIDYRRARLSSEICCGLTSREAAHGELSTRPYFDKIAADKPYIAKKLGVSMDEFEEILSRPPKWYFDYPNSARKLRFVYDTYRRLSGKERLANF